MAAAADVSTSSTVAWPYRLRTMARNVPRPSWMSSVYSASPVINRGSSRRWTADPTSSFGVKSSARCISYVIAADPPAAGSVPAGSAVGSELLARSLPVRHGIA
jgi:hypothetical protein